MNGLSDVPEQLSGSSTNGPTHGVQIDPDTKINTTLTDWVYEQCEKLTETKEGIIHKVPDLLRPNSTPSCNYQPNAVSLGPGHFGEDKLRNLQELKRSTANRLVLDKEREASLRSEIRNNIDSLMSAYPSSETMNAVEAEEMLFLDGCFVLHFILCIMYDRVEDLKIKRYAINSVHNDLFRAENQLPFQLLEILSGNDPKLLVLIDSYICTHIISKDIDLRHQDRTDKPVHLLDRLRTIIIGPRSDTWESRPWQSQSKSSLGGKRTVLRRAKTLAAKGIHLKPNQTGLVKDIFFRPHFIRGTLTLPRITVDDSTRLIFSNLTAYEMCADLDPTISSYICLMASLASEADDVRELQSKDVLINQLGTDETVANLFNEMSQHLHPYSDVYMEVKKKIHKFLEHKTKPASIASRIVEGYNNHFKNPLTEMAVFGGFLALGLTAVQTYFTVYPRGDINN